MNQRSVPEVLAHAWWQNHASRIMDPLSTITAEEIEESLAEMVNAALGQAQVVAEHAARFSAQQRGGPMGAVGKVVGEEIARAIGRLMRRDPDAAS